jgi:hypothetical protein
MVAGLGLVDTLVVIVVIAIAGAFLHWIYEHAVRFFSIPDWRKCPECDRFVLRAADACKHCGIDLRALAHDPRLRPQGPAR